MAIWVTVEDMYDHERYEYGPFDLADAHRYCDAVNGEQLKPGATADVTPAYGVWNKATAQDYDFHARMEHLIAHPADIPPSADAIAAAAGARTAGAWRRLEQEKIALLRCWCSELRDGNVPDVEPELVSVYRTRYVQPHPDGVRLQTEGHFGDVSESRCTLCSGALLHLMIEHEGYGDSTHHYYVPVDSGTLAAARSGRLHGGMLEDWFGSRPGIHTMDGRSRFYRRATVGYAGIDSDLEF